MDFNKFQRSVIFSGADANRSAEEVCDESLRIMWFEMRHCYKIVEKSPDGIDYQYRHDILYELGDTLCLIARMAAALGVPMDKVAEMGLEYWDI